MPDEDGNVVEMAVLAFLGFGVGIVSLAFLALGLAVMFSH